MTVKDLNLMFEEEGFGVEEFVNSISIDANYVLFLNHKNSIFLIYFLYYLILKEN